MTEVCRVYREDGKYDICEVDRDTMTVIRVISLAVPPLLEPLDRTDPGYWHDNL